MDSRQSFVAALGLGLLAAGFVVQVLDVHTDLLVGLGILLMTLGSTGFLPRIGNRYHRRRPSARPGNSPPALNGFH